ncbi:hypothetical protein TWF481_005714 [Arthrobotrys musiformis]|uniref:Uncharacterized protein n=1 Tax=Arthrobotrys musiformis TaxID=47236 RepID=A0AAV9WEJ9_9PEZI
MASSSRGGYQGGGGRGTFQIFKPAGGPTEPDERATKVENKMIVQAKAFPPQAHKRDFPPRRGFGTTGQKTFVRANYFPLLFKPGQHYYRYQIRITPDETKRSTRRRIIDLFIEEGLGEFSNDVVTDGGNICFASRELPLEKLKLSDNRKFEVKLWWQDDVPPAPRDGSRQFNVQIRAQGFISASDLTERYITGDSKHREPGHENDEDISKELIQILNIVLNRGPEMNARTAGAGKNKFFQLPSTGGISADLGGGLEAVQGFYKSVRPSFGRVLCNINVISSPFYKEIPMIDAVSLFLGRRITNEGLREPERRRLSSFLRRVKVTLRHLQSRSWVIGQISQDNSKTSTFECGEYDTISVQQYFEKKYNVTLRFPELQVFQSGHTMVPMEVCTIARGQLYRGKISENQTSNMIRFACRDPTSNAKIITETGLKTLGFNNSPGSIPYKFGVKIDQNMVVIPARVLPTPTIQYSKKTMEVEKGKGQWNLRAQKFYKGCELKRLLVLSFTRGRDRTYTSENVARLISQFRETCEDAGIVHNKSDASACREEKMDVSGSSSEIEALFRKYSTGKPTLMLVILPDEIKDLFQRIKYLGDVKAGIATVVVLFSKAAKGIERQGNKQYWANVLLKVNTRLGGVNHVLPKGDLKWLWTGDLPAMLVGMDVTHPSPTSAPGAPSMAAVVASCDSSFTNYPASLRIQEKNEMIGELHEMFIERLAQYKRNLGHKPKTIIIYRDGVSEGQYYHVLAQELPKVISACHQFEPGYRPCITLIVVGKRHHTRFYPTDDAFADERKNCLPGTVVDRGVTDVYNFDFFLQAHKALQGTARPAHYFVLRCENNYSADDLQRMTMNLSHLFCRATKAVSVCPPAKMADLACDRGRIYLQSIMDTNSEAATQSRTARPETSSEVFDTAAHLWGNGVHRDLTHTMFYI